MNLKKTYRLTTTLVLLFLGTANLNAQNCKSAGQANKNVAQSGTSYYNNGIQYDIKNFSLSASSVNLCLYEASCGQTDIAGREPDPTDAYWFAVDASAVPQISKSITIAPKSGGAPASVNLVNTSCATVSFDIKIPMYYNGKWVHTFTTNYAWTNCGSATKAWGHSSNYVQLLMKDFGRNTSYREIWDKITFGQTEISNVHLNLDNCTDVKNALDIQQNNSTPQQANNQTDQQQYNTTNTTSTNRPQQQQATTNNNSEVQQKLQAELQRQQLINQTQFVGTEKYFDGTLQGSALTFTQGLSTNIGLDGGGAGMGDMVMGGAGLLVGFLTNAQAKNEAREAALREAAEKLKNYHIQQHQQQINNEYGDVFKNTLLSSLSGYYYKISDDGNYTVFIEPNKVTVKDVLKNANYTHNINSWSGQYYYYGEQVFDYTTPHDANIFGIQFDNKTLKVNIPDYASQYWQIALNTNQKNNLKAPYTIKSSNYGSVVSSEQFEEIPNSENYRAVFQSDAIDGNKYTYSYEKYEPFYLTRHKRNTYLYNMYLLADKNLVFGFHFEEGVRTPFLTDRYEIFDFDKEIKDLRKNNEFTITTFFEPLKTGIGAAYYYYQPEKDLLWIFLQNSVMLLNIKTEKTHFIDTRFRHVSKVEMDTKNNIVQIAGFDEYYQPLVKIYNHNALMSEIDRINETHLGYTKEVAAAKFKRLDRNERFVEHMNNTTDKSIASGNLDSVKAAQLEDLRDKINEQFGTKTYTANNANLFTAEDVFIQGELNYEQIVYYNGTSSEVLTARKSDMVYLNTLQKKDGTGATIHIANEFSEDLNYIKYYRKQHKKDLKEFAKESYSISEETFPIFDNTTTKIYKVSLTTRFGKIFKAYHIFFDNGKKYLHINLGGDENDVKKLLNQYMADKLKMLDEQ